MDPAGGAVFYLKGLIWGLGWPVFILFLLAILFALWRRRRIDIVLLTLPVLGFFYMQQQEMYFARWLILLLPPLTVLAAETVRATVEQIGRWQKGNRVNRPTPGPGVRNHVSALLIIILLTLPSTYTALQANYVFSQLDTRTEALIWIDQNIPPGSNLAAELLSPPWGPPLAMPGLKIGPYNFAPVPDGGVMEVDLEQYQAWGVQYIIASSFYYARPLRDKAHQAQLASRLQNLDNKAELIALFQPYQGQYNGFFYHDQVYGPANNTLYLKQPGPTIKIYRLP